MLLAMLPEQDSDEPYNIILREKDDTAAGSNVTFLSSRLRFTKNESGQDVCLVDAGGQEVGVMMGWERGIMEETVKRLCEDHENAQHLKILNVGFGLGIVGRFLPRARRSLIGQPQRSTASSKRWIRPQPCTLSSRLILMYCSI